MEAEASGEGAQAQAAAAAASAIREMVTEAFRGMDRRDLAPNLWRSHWKVERDRKGSGKETGEGKRTQTTGGSSASVAKRALPMRT